MIDSPDILVAIGKSVEEGLELLLCVTAWFLASVEESESLLVSNEDLTENVVDDGDDTFVEDHVVIRLRNRLLSLLELCFAQYIPSPAECDDDETSANKRSISSDQIAFADYVQLAAGKVTSDLRTLLPKEFSDAASPILRSFALLDDGRLIGAFV